VWVTWTLEETFVVLCMGAVERCWEWYMYVEKGIRSSSWATLRAQSFGYMEKSGGCRPRYSACLEIVFGWDWKLPEASSVGYVATRADLCGSVLLETVVGIE
jgi:hypothetical protein